MNIEQLTILAIPFGDLTPENKTINKSIYL
jgi:hypothetical protein